MHKHLLQLLLLNGLTLTAWAAPQSVYCPQKSGYINLGMTPDQVIAACGQPLSQQQSNQPAMEKVPVQQVFFNNQGQSTAFYGVWAIPGGSGNYGSYQPSANSGGNGVQLQVDISNNQVRAVKLNGSDTNAFSICGGANINVGDPASKVYSACGTPTLVNTTYINVPIQSAQKPQVWIYPMGQYQQPMTLTFVNGHLQSIQ